MEETEYNYNTKNGKEPGQAGRPSKDFLENKKALEALEAIKNYFGEDVIAGLLDRSKGNGKTRSKRDLGRDLKGFVESPFVLELLAPFGAFAGAIGLTWMAEDYVKLPMKVESKDDNGNILKDEQGNIIYETKYIPFPPILHTFYHILSTVLLYIAEHIKDIKSAQNKLEEISKYNPGYWLSNAVLSAFRW